MRPHVPVCQVVCSGLRSGDMTTTASESVASCLATVERLTGRRPYTWQSRLAVDHFLQGDIPDAVDVPTGLGKTTVIALWLSALAHGADLPRRLIYVVDRRVVVDQASGDADTLADRLGYRVSDDSILAACREGLGLIDGQRLAVSTLRGQHVDNRAWLADPSSPAIIVGTVDMIGSRLLFNGYGVSPGMRPVHAGLLGADALLVLDEAHLVPPFEALVRRVQELRGQHMARPIPPFRVMSLSATGRTQAPNVLRLQRADWEGDPSLRVRLFARKRLRLTGDVPASELPATLATHAWGLSQPASSVLVFCNSRKGAQETSQILTKRLRDTFGKETAPPELLVGERRVRERSKLVEKEVFQRFLPRRHANPAPGKAGPVPAFLIATSAGEVGIDLDADHLVCDLVEWERMIQRLGRVNRRLNPADDARVVIVPSVMERKKNEAENDIDAKRLEKLKAPFESPFWPATIDGWRDASPAHLAQLKSDERLAKDLSDAQTPEILRPLLMPALIDSWAMTSVIDASRPEIQPWLRGWVDDRPQTRVVWRRHFPLRTVEADAILNDRVAARDLAEFFDAAAPHLSEALDAPTDRVAAVLRKRADAWFKARTTRAGGQTDAALEPILLTLKADGSLDQIYDVPWLTRQKTDTIQWLLADRTVIVDARLGGLDQDGLLDPAASSLVPTLDGDRDEWGLDLIEAAGFRIREAKTTAAGDDPNWRAEFRWRRDPEDESEQAKELRVEVWRGPRRNADEFPRGNPALARRPQGLAAHLEETARSVEAIARRLNLKTEHIAMLRAAALVHDLGKDRDLWQNAMGALRQGRPYAKTAGHCVPRMLEIGRKTYRHEFGSLRDALDASALANLSPEWRALALHLVAAHHGWARPAIAPRDPNALDATCEVEAREAAHRFFHLHTLWGPWGLAWWEALIRAADGHASAKANADAEGA
jgi:CRISPR-associated endonuclease/helicase Cas3